METVIEEQGEEGSKKNVDQRRDEVSTLWSSTVRHVKRFFLSFLVHINIYGRIFSITRNQSLALTCRTPRMSSNDSIAI